MTPLTTAHRERHIDHMIHIMNADPSALAEALRRQFALATGETTITQAALGRYDAVNAARNLQQSWRRDLLAKLAACAVPEVGHYSINIIERSRIALSQTRVREVIGEAAMTDLLARIRPTKVTYLYLRTTPFGGRRPK